MAKYFLKSCCLFIVVLVLFFTVFPSANAAEGSPILVSETVEQVGDDLYLTISVYEFQTDTRSSTFQKSGSKVYAARDSNGNVLWKYTISGIFTVNQGVSAVCTTAVGSHEIYDSNWHFNGDSTYASGKQAIADAEFYKKMFGIKVETKSCHVVLTCDANGNLS